MKGFYPKILKQAYSLTKDHKIFWVAGLFLVWPNLLRTLLWMLLVASLLQIDPMSQSQSGETQEGSIWVGLASVFVISLLVAYYYRSRAVVNVAIKQLRNQRQLDNNQVYQEADPFTWELMKFGFTLSVGLILLIAFLSSPVMYLSAHNFSQRAGILGIFGFGVFLPIFTVLYYSMVFAPMFIVLHQMPVSDAFKVSLDLVKRNWIYLVFTSVLLLIIELIVIILAFCTVYLLAYGFVILSQIFYDVGGSSSINIFQVAVGIMVFVVFFISQSLVAAFQRIVWAIMFFEIVRPIKTEEVVQPETVPEIIS